MATADEDPGAPPGEPSPPPEARFTLLPSTRLYLALLVMVWIIPLLASSGARGVAKITGDEISAADFEKFVAAEINVRQAFGVRALTSLAGASSPLTEASALSEAIGSYRELQKTLLLPNIARRLLILEHTADKEFDPSPLIEKSLPRALKAVDANEADIRAETALWRDVYARGRVQPADVPDYERRIRAMRLRFLEDRALADLYAAAGNPEQAGALNRRLEARASRFLVSAGAFMLLGILGFLTGLVFLCLFAWTAIDKNWRRVARTDTQPQPLSWGELLDVFVFYLLVFRGAGFAAGLLAPRFMAELTPRTALPILAGLQLGTGFIAMAYFQAKARGRGVSLASIGLTARGALFANIGYGVAGYLAMLPLVFALRLISQVIFRHIPNTAPNPIMPLMASEQDMASRLLIFGMVAVAAPFFEELFFRGALFGGLRTRWGWVVCAVISGVLFAVVHPPQDWLPIFGLGFGLATMREMRQSLVPCFIAHGIQNTGAFLLLSALFSDN